MYLADIEEALQVIGPHFAQIYGQGECPMTISVLPKSDVLDTPPPTLAGTLGLGWATRKPWSR